MRISLGILNVTKCIFCYHCLSLKCNISVMSREQTQQSSQLELPNAHTEISSSAISILECVRRGPILERSVSTRTTYLKLIRRKADKEFSNNMLINVRPNNEDTFDITFDSAASHFIHRHRIVHQIVADLQPRDTSCYWKT